MRCALQYSQLTFSYPKGKKKKTHRRTLAEDTPYLLTAFAEKGQAKAETGCLRFFCCQLAGKFIDLPN